MDTITLKKRMYFFVPYNISEIQKGIQAGHAALEYAKMFGGTKEYHNFIYNDKTWIILNGGTTRQQFFCKESDEIGTLNQIAVSLNENYIAHARFYEPDLNYALTAVCFLADERVWDKEKYPDFIPAYDYTLTGAGGTGTLTATSGSTVNFVFQTHEEWVDKIGGVKNVFLRELIKDKRLA